MFILSNISSFYKKISARYLRDILSCWCAAELWVRNKICFYWGWILFLWVEDFCFQCFVHRLKQFCWLFSPFIKARKSDKNITAFVWNKNYKVCFKQLSMNYRIQIIALFHYTIMKLFHFSLNCNKNYTLKVKIYLKYQLFLTHLDLNRSLDTKAVI